MAGKGKGRERMGRDGMGMGENAKGMAGKEGKEKRNDLMGWEGGGNAKGKVGERKERGYIVVEGRQGKGAEGK